MPIIAASYMGLIFNHFVPPLTSLQFFLSLKKNHENIWPKWKVSRHSIATVNKLSRIHSHKDCRIISTRVLSTNRIRCWVNTPFLCGIQNHGKCANFEERYCLREFLNSNSSCRNSAIPSITQNKRYLSWNICFNAWNYIHIGAAHNISNSMEKSWLKIV